MRNAVLALSVAFVAAAPALAQQPPAGEPVTVPSTEPSIPLNVDPPKEFDKTKLFDGMTLAEAQAIAEKAGYAATKMTGTYDYLEVMTSSGYRFEISLADCPESGEMRCSSLNLRSYAFNENPRVTLKGVNEWNTGAWGVRGMLFKDGTSGVTMNLGVNGGVTEAWVAARIGNYDYWLTEFGKFVNGT